MILAAMDNSSKQTSYYFIADPSGNKNSRDQKHLE